jgi:hypothetical protein
MIWGIPRSKVGVMYTKEELLEMLSSDNASDRMAGIHFLEEYLFEEEPDLKPVIIQALKRIAHSDNNTDIRFEAESLLGCIETKHSEFGIASFSINIGIGIIIILLFGFPNNTNPINLPDSIICALPFVFLITLALGIWGILQKDREKTFAILGIILSVLAIISYLVILFILSS